MIFSFWLSVYSLERMRNVARKRKYIRKGYENVFKMEQKKGKKKLEDKRVNGSYYNKMKYYLGNGCELLSALTILAVFQDSCV